jgi:transcriptional regulator with XRE-family HTH domain
LNRPLDSHPAGERVPDSPVKSRRFTDFSEDKGDPKTAQQDLDNPEKPDRVRWATEELETIKFESENGMVLPQAQLERTRKMKTFGQAIVEARKAAGLTQKAVAERLHRADGRRVLPPWLNDLEHDRRYPPENPVIEQLAQVLNVSTDFLYFHARRLPANIEGDFDEGSIEAAYRAFRNELQQAPTSDQRRRPSRINSHPGAWA